MRQLITVTFYKNHCLKGDAFLCMLILSLDNRINIQCMKYKLSHCKNHSCVKITYTQYTQYLMLLANQNKTVFSLPIYMILGVEFN